MADEGRGQSIRNVEIGTIGPAQLCRLLNWEQDHPLLVLKIIIGSRIGGHQANGGGHGLGVGVNGVV